MNIVGLLAVSAGLLGSGFMPSPGGFSSRRTRSIYNERPVPAGKGERRRQIEAARRARARA